MSEPKTPEANAILRSALNSHGVKFSDVRRILLTHAHEDHCGLAKQVRDEAKNAEILVHKWETGHLFGRLAQDSHKNLMKLAGVPAEVFEEMRKAYSDVSLLTDSLSETEFGELHDEMEIEFESGALQVMHTPGHTPGSCSFIRKADRTIICGDCVLKRITPNPVISPDPTNPRERFRSLSEYLASLDRIREESPTLIYGGHGEPIDDFDEIYYRYHNSIAERQKAVLDLVKKAGVTAWEVAQTLFPNAIDKEIHRFLAISESVAHLDYATASKKIRVREDENVEYFESAI